MTSFSICNDLPFITLQFPQNPYFCQIMSHFIRKYCSYLFLFLFLFPQVQKGVHDFEHRHDSHCDAKAEQHLHPLEHVCSLCDFSVPISVALTNTHFDFFIEVYLVPFVIQPFKLASASFWPQLPPRAPPVLFS